MKILAGSRTAAVGISIVFAVVACAAQGQSTQEQSDSHGTAVALSPVHTPVLASIAPKSMKSKSPNARTTKRNHGAPSPTSSSTSSMPTSPGTGAGSATTGQLAACGGSAENTAGGADPWGGCWPGPGNTGVPAGTNLVSVDSGNVNPPNAHLPSDNTGWAYSNSDGYIVVTAQKAVIDGIADSEGIAVPGGDSLTVKNSSTGLINDEGTSLVVENSTLNGGDQWEFSTVNGGSNITVENSNLSGGGHEVLCYNDCTVTNSWLHDNADGSAAGAHQNGFLADGGSGFDLQHNSVYCTGGCTADISFLSIDSNATVTKNLLIASPDSAYCVYPGPDQPTESGISNMVWEDNVFQRGANGNCATYGPVYAWYPGDGSGNVWEGNMWNNGAPVSGS
jgi:hypothetical protein